MALRSEDIEIFLQVFQNLRVHSSRRLDHVEEQSVQQVTNFLAGLASNVKNGKLENEEYGAEWKHAAGGTRKKKKNNGRNVGALATSSVRLRDTKFREEQIAAWALNYADGEDSKIEEYMHYLESWEDFDVFHLEKLTKGHVLATVVYHALEQYDLMKIFEIDEETLFNFLAEVETKYKANPYHNATHAADVLQSAMCMLRMDNIGQELTSLEQLCVILACAIHDVGHPGVNNDFLIKTQDREAIVYSDISVNENMHVRLFYEILGIADCNILKDFSTEDYRFMRTTIKNIVIKTDMIHHKDILQSVDTLVATANDGATGVALFRSLTPDARQIALQFLVHAADISNTCRPPSPCGNWAKRVTDEFFQQGDRERKQGLPVAPLLNRATGHLASSQLAFVTYVSKPMMESLAPILPEFTRMAFVYMQNNMNLYQAIIAEGPVSRYKTIGVEDPRMKTSGSLRLRMSSIAESATIEMEE